MTDYQTLLSEKVAEIYRYLDRHQANAQERAEVILWLLEMADVECFGEYYFRGVAYPLRTDILTGLRAQRLRPYLKKKGWMTGSDIAKICLSLQKYVDEKPRGKDEYQAFLKWLRTGPVDGEHDHFRFERFFEANNNPDWSEEKEKYIEIDDRKQHYFY